MIMKRKYLSLLSILVSLCLVILLCAGCNTQPEKEAEVTTANENDAPESATVQQDDPVEETEKAKWDTSVYPLCEQTETLTMYIGMSPVLEQFMDTYAEHLCIIEAEKVTNVQLKFTQPSTTEAVTQYALMFLSGDYCDMIKDVSNYYTGGGDAAIQDGIIVDLSDYLEDYSPAFYSIIMEDESIVKTLTSDLGYISEYSTIRTSFPGISSGPQIRQDWLNELGLEAPKTYAQYTEVMRAFKTEYGISDPLYYTANCNMFAEGYGITAFSVPTDRTDMTSHLYQVDSVVRTSLLDDSYKDYLQMVADWYSEGLINSDFFSGSTNPMSSDFQSVVTSGNAGIWSIDANLMTNLADLSNDENFITAGISYPVIKEGDILHFNASTDLVAGHKMSISTQCKDIELACRWMDFWFTDYGRELSNYGFEGETFNYTEDGFEFTELITNNPDGKTYTQAMAYYNFVQIPQYQDATRAWGSYNEDQLSAIETWTKNQDSAYVIPSGVSLTTDESNEYSTKFADIYTFASENITRFINGDYSLDDFDSFQKALKEMGIEECVAIYQEALNRYMVR